MRELQELLAKVKETFNSLTQKTFKEQKVKTSHSLRKVPNFSLFRSLLMCFNSLTHPVKNNMLYMHLDYIFVTATLANISKKRHVFYGRPALAPLSLVMCELMLRAAYMSPTKLGKVMSRSPK